MKISLFGTGYVGLVTGASLANLGHDVLCMDVDESKITQLQQGAIPFFEPGLKELVQHNMQAGRLRFTTNTKDAVQFGSVIFNCVGTPCKDDGSANLEYVFTVAKNVATHSQGYQLLINKSTVPPGTAKQCHDLIQQTNSEAMIDVVSNPEFLKEGAAVHDFTHPDKIVIGTTSEQARGVMRKVYSGLVRPYMNLLETNWETAEMIKYANNSFLPMKISFINEIANIADRVGADVKTIAKALGMDYRISPKFLNAGIGYGGSCFPKDIRALVTKAKEHGYDACLLKSVDICNTRQKSVIVQKVKDELGDLTNKKVTIWGLSFKPKTSDIREAPSLVIIEQLLALGAEVHVNDPIAIEEVKKILGSKVTYHNSIYDCVEGSNAIILVTEWDEYRNVDFNVIGNSMRTKMLFDGRNIYDPALVKQAGFTYHGIGRK